MFAQRALSAIILGPLALLLIYFGDRWGGLVYFLPFALLLTLATIEYAQLAHHLGWQVPVWLLLPLALGQWVLAQWAPETWIGPSLLVSFLAILALVLWSYENHRSQTAPADWMALMTGLMLMGWIGGHFFRLRGLEIDAWQWTMLAMVTAWFADSGAYLVGKFLAGRFFLGRHRMSPRLSPNKTMEGFFGGIVCGTFGTVLVAYLADLPLLAALILGLLLTGVGPLGDLGISLLKREAGVKDSGKLLPGHGGALDRIDTLLWAVAITYYLALYLPYYF